MLWRLKSQLWNLMNEERTQKTANDDARPCSCINVDPKRTKETTRLELSYICCCNPCAFKSSLRKSEFTPHRRRLAHAMHHCCKSIATVLQCTMRISTTGAEIFGRDSWLFGRTPNPSTLPHSPIAFILLVLFLWLFLLPCYSACAVAFEYFLKFSALGLLRCYDRHGDGYREGDRHHGVSSVVPRSSLRLGLASASPRGRCAIPRHQHRPRRDAQARKDPSPEGTILSHGLFAYPAELLLNRVRTRSETLGSWPCLASQPR